MHVFVTPLQVRVRVQQLEKSASSFRGATDLVLRPSLLQPRWGAAAAVFQNEEGSFDVRNGKLGPS